MPKFITGKDLEDAVYDIIWDAQKDLLIVCPYIKLDDYFKKLFEKHLSNPRLHITILFGKNVGQVNKSLNRKDLDYFKQFLNISLVYIPNLHAKYYANDEKGVVTSINLYDYSFKNNLEYGVLFERKGLGILSTHPDLEIWNQSQDLANENEVVYVKRPVYEKSFLSRNYMSSKVLLDRTAELYRSKPLEKGDLSLEDFEDELDANEYKERPTRGEVEKPVAGPKFFDKKTSTEEPFKPGFCIRTGEKIPFNPKSPYSYDAYKSWVYWGNENFAEKYCHYSGELSNGQTSMRKPILYKNLNKT